MAAYYNEIEPFAAQWLRNLIEAGHIAGGDVDTRSIEDVRPDDIRPYKQAHFFAGIGVWSYALRLAGWPDDREVWTGSCPCQPFSAAGKGLGFDDERHLWPAWHWLIAECRPTAIFGEQVASKAVEPWIDLVQADLEALDYAYGCIPFPAASVTAPNPRDRAFWMAHAHVHGRAAHAVAEFHHAEYHAKPRVGAGGLADTGGGRRLGRQGVSAGCLYDGPHAERIESHDGFVGDDETRISRIERASPTNGFWRDADWLLCRDGKWRPVEPGTFPLVNGATARMGRLRAYGNAINAQAAKAFIEVAMECMP